MDIGKSRHGIGCAQDLVSASASAPSVISPCPLHDLGLCNELHILEPGSVGPGVFKSVEKGLCLVPEGSSPFGLIAVVEGTLKLSRSLPDGRTQIISIRYPGDVVTSLGGSRPWPFSVEAVTQATLCILDCLALQRARKQHPELDVRLAEHMHEEVVRSQEHIMTLGRKTPIERLASFLVELDERQGRDNDPTDELAIPILRADIADYLGLESETVSRLFTKLKAAGVIEPFTPSRIALVDRKLLKNLAEGKCDAFAANRHRLQVWKPQQSTGAGQSAVR